MAGDLAAFTLLGDSADWLKDTGGVSIREYRLAAMDAYRAAWASPTSNTRFATLQAVFGRLFDALRHNQLYPEAVILSGPGDKTVRYLAAPESLRKDFELLRNFCVVNKFGMGEIHLLHIVLLFCRTLYQGAGRDCATRCWRKRSATCSSSGCRFTARTTSARSARR